MCRTPKCDSVGGQVCGVRDLSSVPRTGGPVCGAGSSVRGYGHMYVAMSFGAAHWSSSVWSVGRLPTRPYEWTEPSAMMYSECGIMNVPR